ncbi:hypothetical protein OF001_U280008 [Pseudomonas sp. OF001]|nr:hypothetical protein OF001_U280008 [Pseudomonas sp. OF001]
MILFRERVDDRYGRRGRGRVPGHGLPSPVITTGLIVLNAYDKKPLFSRAICDGLEFALQG